MGLSFKFGSTPITRSQKESVFQKLRGKAFYMSQARRSHRKASRNYKLSSLAEMEPENGFFWIL
jgi:hypothetical protein